MGGGNEGRGGRRERSGEENGVSFLSSSVLPTPPHDTLYPSPLPVNLGEPRETPVFSRSLIGSSQYSRAKQDLFCSLCARVPGTQ